MLAIKAEPLREGHAHLHSYKYIVGAWPLTCIMILLYNYLFTVGICISKGYLWLYLRYER